MTIGPNGSTAWRHASRASILWVAVVASVLGALVPAAVRPVLAGSATFGGPTASATFGTQVVFEQPVNLAAVPDRVEVLITVPGALGPNVTEVPAPAGTGSQTLRYAVALADGHIFPNTRLTGQWRLTFGGTVETSAEVSVLYEDTRFAWRTRTGQLVRIHWYEGDDAFGKQALDIAEQGIRTAETTLGVTETEPIDFFVYAQQSPFYDALGPGTRENVGGTEVPEIRTMFALIAPGATNGSFARTVLPHELTHLVFNTAVKNPYHPPPNWLNEGLAVYLSEGYTASYAGLVRSASADASLMPLDGLVGAFPSTRDQFVLAYAESVSAVDFLIRTYGRPRLVSLIRSYTKGVTDDEAFTAALGLDTAGFNTAWLADNGARAPVKTGPRPAPAGPVPPGWSGESAGAGSGASANPGAPSTAGSSSVAGSSPSGSGGDGGASASPVAVALIGGVAVIVGTVVLARARRRT